VIQLPARITNMSTHIHISIKRSGKCLPPVIKSRSHKWGEQKKKKNGGRKNLVRLDELTHLLLVATCILLQLALQLISDGLQVFN
jgi:hypothetical protein